jgi:hypothetical protein
MMRREWLGYAGRVVILAAGMLVVCGMGSFYEQRDILDAAELFEENRSIFENIRQHYPGPFTEVRRIPAFEEADNRAEDIAFLEGLQRSIPVEILELYSWGKAGHDMIQVVVGTYGLAVSGSVVSLISFESFSREDVVEGRIEVFDKCDDRVLAWLDHTARTDPYADAYCRIDEHWYAYQSIT